jgi:hypothetical protein
VLPCSPVSAAGVPDKQLIPAVSQQQLQWQQQQQQHPRQQYITTLSSLHYLTEAAASMHPAAVAFEYTFNAGRAARFKRMLQLLPCSCPPRALVTEPPCLLQVQGRAQDVGHHHQQVT